MASGEKKISYLNTRSSFRFSRYIFSTFCLLHESKVISS